MISYASSCYPIAVQSVRNAIGCDGRGETKNAYCQYLSCMLFVIQALKDEAWDRQELTELCHNDTFKLFKLTEQCLARAHDILKSFHGHVSDTKNENVDCLDTRSSLHSPLPAARRHSHSSQSTSPLPPDQRRMTRSLTNYTNESNAEENKYKALTELLPTPPGYTTATRPQNVHVKNQEMFQAYQRRKTLRGKQRYAAINFNLDTFRKEAEKMAIRKAKEKAAFIRILEQQKQVKIEAERRWNKRQHHSTRDKEYRQNLLANILAYEEEAGWPKTFRKTLTPNCEPVVIMNAIQAILASRDHPLSKVLTNLKLTTYQRIRTLLEQFEVVAPTTTTKENDYLCPVDSLDRRKFTSPQTVDVSKTATDGDAQVVTDVANDQTESVKGKVSLTETNKTDNSTSLEREFDEMGCSMFDSDSEEDLNKNMDDKHEEDTVNTSDKHEEITGEVEDGMTDYKVLEAGYETFKRNQEFFKDLPCNEQQPKNETDTQTSNESVKTPQTNEFPVNVNTDESGNAANIDLCGESSSEYSSLVPDVKSWSDYDFCHLKTPKLSVTSDCSVDETDANSSTLGNTYNSLNQVESDEYETLTNKRKPNAKPESAGIYEEILYEETKKVESVEIKPRIRANTRKIYREFSDDGLARISEKNLQELDNIVQDLLFGIDRLQSALLLTYEGIDTPEGRDQCYVTLEAILFKSLWSWIIQMFRQLNAYKEDALRKIMQKHSRSGPKEMNVSEKFTLLDESQEFTDQLPYQIAIEELKHLPQYETPLEKLECVVRMSKAICHCVETYWQKKGESNPPQVGGDDLLPIVTFVVLKSRAPQLVSECHAVEEFIHEGYLLGEEGYCLTTLHTAVSYLVSLGREP